MLIDQLLAGDVWSEAFYTAAAEVGPAELMAVLELTGHGDPAVRESVTSALPHLGDHGRPEVVDALITLTRDPDRDVRDSACFGLGTQLRDVDTPQVRDALFARVDDIDTEARCEALVGLAYRRDARTLEPVRRALSRPSGQLYELELIAAGALSEPALHPLVLRHQSGWDDDDRPVRIPDAVRRLTDPTGPGDDVIAGVAELYRRRAYGYPDGRALTWWSLMNQMLDIAPYRAAEFLALAADLLSHDPLARDELLTRSALASVVD